MFPTDDEIAADKQHWLDNFYRIIYGDDHPFDNSRPAVRAAFYRWGHELLPEDRDAIALWLQT